MSASSEWAARDRQAREDAAERRSRIRRRGRAIMKAAYFIAGLWIYTVLALLAYRALARNDYPRPPDSAPQHESAVPITATTQEINHAQTK